MKSFKEYLEEINKKTYASALDRKKHGDYYDDKVGDTSEILKRAEREHGKKFADQVKDVGDKPRTRALVGPKTDPLSSRTQSRVTKAGKINKTDAKNLKSTMKGENPDKPDLKGERDKKDAARRAKYKKELNRRLKAGLPTTGNWNAKYI